MLLLSKVGNEIRIIQEEQFLKASRQGFCNVEVPGTCANNGRLACGYRC